MTKNSHVSRLITSIAMTTYNAAPFLEQQLESIAKQTQLPDELVIGDDGSSDDTLNLIQQFAERLEFPVRVTVNTKRLGSVRNFEETLARCTGEILFLADQDDVWTHNKIEIMSRVFDEDPEVGLVFSDAEVIDEKSNSLGFSVWESLRLDHKAMTRLNQGHAFEVLLKQDVVMGAATAIRASLFPVARPFNLEWIHDGWVATVLASRCKFVAIPDKLIYYRQHRQQQIGVRFNGLYTPSPDYVLDNLEVQLQRFKVLLEHLEVNLETTNTSLVLVREKMVHLTFRLRLRKAGLLELHIGIGELITGRYFRYSWGFRSFLKDVLAVFLVEKAQ